MLYTRNSNMKTITKFLLWTVTLTGIATIIGLNALRTPPGIIIEEVRREALILRDGRLYRAGETAPFSGVMTEYYPDGILQSRSRISQGLLEGLSEGWHTNGHIQIQERFMAGISHGQRTKWHANGIKLSEATIVQGKMEGLYRRWNEGGSLVEEIPMKAGQPEGVAKSFFPSGFVKAEAMLRDGRLMEQHFWKDGERADPPQVATSSRSTDTR